MCQILQTDNFLSELQFPKISDFVVKSSVLTWSYISELGFATLKRGSHPKRRRTCHIKNAVKCNNHLV